MSRSLIASAIELRGGDEDVPPAAVASVEVPFVMVDRRVLCRHPYQSFDFSRLNVIIYWIIDLSTPNLSNNAYLLSSEIQRFNISIMPIINQRDPEMEAGFDAKGRSRGRPRNREPSRLLSVRVPASVYDPVKEWADTHSEPMSAIVVEALQAYLDREILKKCRICGTQNSEDSQFCKKCGRPLTAEAEKRFQEIRNALVHGMLSSSDVYDKARKLRSWGYPLKVEPLRELPPDQKTLLSTIDCDECQNVER